MNYSLIILFFISLTFSYSESFECGMKNGYYRDTCYGYQKCVDGKTTGASGQCFPPSLMDLKTLKCLPPNEVDCSITMIPEEEMMMNKKTTMKPMVNKKTTMKPMVNKQTTMKPMMEQKTTMQPMMEQKTTMKPIINNENTMMSNYKIVCYYTNWPFYRPDDGKFVPENVDTNLCTHVMYSFIVLDGSTLTYKIHDDWIDVQQNLFNRVIALKDKRKDLKTMVAIGGWVDSAGDKYSRMVNDAASRRKFIESILEFLKLYQFDGLDLDWEFPVCWQAECRGNVNDKQSFALLVKELREAFKPYNYLLSAAISPNPNIIDAAYDIKALNENLDFVNVMNYDYHGAWEKIVEHQAPLYARPESASFSPNDKILNVNNTINHLINKGLAKEKIIVGMPLYGRSEKLVNKDGDQGPYYGLGSPSFGLENPGKPGKYTREGGILSYYEICDYVKSGEYKVHVDQNSGPYVSSMDEVVTYDNAKSLMKKTNFVRMNALGGAMVWALDLDDFNGKCCSVKYPLLNAIFNGLMDKPFNIDCP